MDKCAEEVERLEKQLALYATLRGYRICDRIDANTMLKIIRSRERTGSEGAAKLLLAWFDGELSLSEDWRLSDEQ